MFDVRKIGRFAPTVKSSSRPNIVCEREDLTFDSLSASHAFFFSFFNLHKLFYAKCGPWGVKEECI
jgi:hypothetical protein